MTSIFDRIWVVVVALIVLTLPARADYHFTVGTNWLPDAERGGLDQAEAAGIYRKYGLDVVRPAAHSSTTLSC